MATPDSAYISALQCRNCGSHYQVDEYQPIFGQLGRLYHSNDVPHPLELDLIQHIQTDVSRLDIDIQHVQDILAALKAKRDPMAAHLQVIVAPIRRVPRDVIGEILLHALDGRTVSLDTRKAPWSYAQVCRLWREELLSRPSIWTNLEIFAQQSAVPARYHDPNALSALLFRSIGHEITIYLNDNNCPTPLAITFLDTAIAHSPRWKAATLVIPRSSLGSLARLQGHLPRLSTLQFNLAGAFSRNVPPEVLANAFEHAPALRGVSFSNFGNLHKMRLPWTQITHFRDTSERGMHSIKLLQKMPNLQCYHVQGFHRPVNPVTVPITFNQLRSVSLYSGAPHFLDMITSLQLRLPALSAIHLFDYNNKTPIPLQELLSLIQTSQCTITKLGMHFDWRVFTGPRTSRGWNVGDWNVLSLLKALPTIETMEFEEEPPSALFDAITTDSSILPNLRALQFNAFCFAKSNFLLIETIKSLLRARKSITKIFLVGEAAGVDMLNAHQRLFESMNVVRNAYDPDDIWQDG